MKKLWNFGGTHTEFGKKISDGFDKIQFGRHNVDYSDVDGFIKKIETNPDEYPIPDIIVFNMNPDTHYLNFGQKITPYKDFEKLINLIKTNFFFQVRLTEWFFSNHKNKRILFLTSQQSNSIIQDGEDLSSEIFEDGDLLLYRMTRALEHQLIHGQNVRQENYINNNIIMGVCVGHNVENTPEYLNLLLKSDKLKKNIYSIGEHTLTLGFVNMIQLVEDVFPSFQDLKNKF
jgi:hypothetical protein